MLRIHKDDPRQKSFIAFAIMFGFIGFVAVTIAGVIFFPPDYASEPPKYPDQLLILVEIADVFIICSCSIMAIKLADEKEILPAAGFTILAIAQGLNMVTNYELLGSDSIESLEKTNQIYLGSSLLAFPGILLVATYLHFPRWLNTIAVFSSLPYLISAFIFVAGSRDFGFIDSLSGISFGIQAFVFVMWGIIVWRKRNQ